MAKMTKEQSTKFDKLFEDTIDWGYDDNCIGLFDQLLSDDIDPESHNLYYLTTCINEENQQVEILEFDGSGYYDLVGYIPINNKTKSVMKKVVTCLLGGGTFDDVREIKGIQ
ncbi:hypothetical protein ZPAH1_orf00116 [Aeromonas phage ZPAH1]|nr:hypothetical protein ZPAH1_orf00116 [Aeromonas phage ZPAH1]